MQQNENNCLTKCKTKCGFFLFKRFENIGEQEIIWFQPVKVTIDICLTCLLKSSLCIIEHKVITIVCLFDLISFALSSILVNLYK